jgi:hypothetical protein
LQAATDSVACIAYPHEHQSTPLTTRRSGMCCRPTRAPVNPPNNKTQHQSTPLTTRLSLVVRGVDWCSCGSATHATRSVEACNAAPRHGEGGQRRRRTAALRCDAGRVACCGPCPGPAPAANSPATAAPHDTSPSNNNRMEERRISCRQQQAPPPRDAAKMSPQSTVGFWIVLLACCWYQTRPVS